MQPKSFFLVLVLLLIGASAILFAYRFSLSALPGPGRIETYVATKAKLWLVRRSARRSSPPAQVKDPVGEAVGSMIYRGECAACHGVDGRTPTAIGRWMYPRTLDLGSREVQQWSDAELFWIVKNGIRLSGMPGFGKIHSDQEIWNLVQYVRSLGAEPRR